MPGCRLPLKHRQAASLKPRQAACLPPRPSLKAPPGCTIEAAPGCMIEALPGCMLQALLQARPGATPTHTLGGPPSTAPRRKVIHLRGGPLENKGAQHPGQTRKKKDTRQPTQHTKKIGTASPDTSSTSRQHNYTLVLSTCCLRGVPPQCCLRTFLLRYVF